MSSQTTRDFFELVDCLGLAPIFISKATGTPIKYMMDWGEEGVDVPEQALLDLRQALGETDKDEEEP